jgi:hypothetical protein
VELEHVILPMRDLEVAAASRVRVSDYGAGQGVAGGLVGTWSPRRQQTVLAEAMYRFVHGLVERDIPFTTLAFPRFARDWEYLYRKLGWLGPHLTADDWKRAVEGRYRPDLVHETPLSAEERRRVLLTLPRTLVGRAGRALSRLRGRR